MEHQLIFSWLILQDNESDVVEDDRDINEVDESKNQEDSTTSQGGDGRPSTARRRVAKAD